MNEAFLAAREAIFNARTIAIAAHENPDGDAYGSILGLGLALEAAGKSCDLLADERFPHFSYIPGFSQLQSVDEARRYDLVIRVDLGDVRRMGRGSAVFSTARKTLNFDHHMENAHDSDILIHEPTASSTCEILARFLLDTGFDVPPAAATALYAGLTTDSNRFLYDTADAGTLRTAADLIDHGADKQYVYLYEYQREDPKLMAFEGDVVRGATFLQDGKVIVANLTHERVAATGYTMPEVEGVVSKLLTLAGVEVAVILKEQEPERQKISFRSKSTYDVQKLAKSLGGGGHQKAAGASLDMTNDEAWPYLISILEGLSL